MAINLNLKIEKKDLWLLSAIMVFLVAIGYVIAYGSGDPTVHGHDAGEIGEIEIFHCTFDFDGVGWSTHDWVLGDCPGASKIPANFDHCYVGARRSEGCGIENGYGFRCAIHAGDVHSSVNCNPAGPDATVECNFMCWDD